MTATPQFVSEPGGRVPVAASSDLVVVGGGPAGTAAALAGARNGLSVTLLERYPYLGGLASGGMVLVLDDMCNGQEIAVRGLCADLIARLERLGLAVTPPEADRRSDAAMWRKWSRWGVFDFTSHLKPQPIVYAAAFDPDGFKRVSNDMIAESKINLRLHSWFSRAIVEDGAIKGVICESKEGRQAILGKIVVDATGDLDVAASAGAPFIEGAYIVTTVFRLGGVNIEEAERFEYEEPEAWYSVGRMLDIAAPISQIVREGQVGTSSAQARSATGIVVSPSGTQATLGVGGASSIALSEQGFYSVRLQGMGSRRPYEVAVNLDPSESELSAMSPTEFVASATGRAAVTVGGQSLEHPEETVEDIEKKQANWWYLLLAGVAALVAEAVLANQLSKRAGTGLSHSPNPSLP
jgi:hypothetical protein